MKTLLGDSELVVLLVIMIICIIGLALTGVLSLFSTLLLLIGSAVELLNISWRAYQVKSQLQIRGNALHADAALQIRHLGGLPIPLQSVGNLFLQKETVRIETDHFTWQLPLLQITQIMPMTGDQVKNLTDQQLTDLLGAGSSRLLSAVRDQIRRGIRTVYQSEMLLISYRTREPAMDSPPDDNDIYLLILAVTRQHHSLMYLLSQRQVQPLLAFNMIAPSVRSHARPRPAGKQQ